MVCRTHASCSEISRCRRSWTSQFSSSQVTMVPSESRQAKRVATGALHSAESIRSEARTEQYNRLRRGRRRSRLRRSEDYFGAGHIEGVVDQGLDLGDEADRVGQLRVQVEGGFVPPA